MDASCLRESTALVCEQYAVALRVISVQLLGGVGAGPLNALELLGLIGLITGVVLILAAVSWLGHVAQRARVGRTAGRRQTTGCCLA